MRASRCTEIELPRRTNEPMETELALCNSPVIERLDSNATALPARTGRIRVVSPATERAPPTTAESAADSEAAEITPLVDICPLSSIGPYMCLVDSEPTTAAPATLMS